VLHRTQLHQV